MTEGRFRITLVDVDTGIVLNQAGRWLLRGQPVYEPSFDTEAAALALKDDLLVLFPWAEVVVLDTAAPSGSGTRVYHPREAATVKFRTLNERRIRYTRSFFGRLFGAPPPDPYDPSSYRLEREDES